MCCGEEIELLKSELGPLLGGRDRLSFDLLDGKMTIEGKLDAAAVERVMTAVSRTGMEAMPWDGACASGVCVSGRRDEENRGRLLACIASFSLMLAALASEAFSRGSLVAVLAGERGLEGAAPPFSVVLYLGAVAAGGWYVFPKAVPAARKLRPDMNLLMTLAVLGAMGLGEWLEAASVSFLFSLALLLESKSVERARREIAALLDLSPPVARCVGMGGRIEEKPVEEVPAGTVVVVRPGERIPLDGVVAGGYTSVNQAPITGESLPVAKGPGDEVFAGTINEEGAIEFRSTGPASGTMLSRIVRMVEEGRLRRAPAEQWVEKFARVYTPAMMAVALGTALVPPLLFGAAWGQWFYAGLVVLVIACPCALVISTPVSIAAGLAAAARNGILIKGGTYLEAPARLKALAFDKTGTLTFGRPEVKAVVAAGDCGEGALLAEVAALEMHSTHPLARAIVRHVRSRGVSPSVAESVTAIPGEGARGTVEGKVCRVGGRRMLESPGEGSWAREAADRLERAGHSLVVMACGERVRGVIGLADATRPEARGSIASLRGLGLEKIVMITGDNGMAARTVAEAARIEDCRHDLLPGDKVRLVSDLAREFGPVAMVGDGINDAPAMAAATVGIAMGAMGSDAAVETADIALMSDDLSRIPWLVRHSRRTVRIIRQNIFFTMLVKSVFLTLAAAGVATLWGAIAADMGASLLVILNGLRLLGPAGAQDDAKHLAVCG